MVVSTKLSEVVRKASARTVFRVLFFPRNAGPSGERKPERRLSDFLGYLIASRQVQVCAQYLHAGFFHKKGVLTQVHWITLEGTTLHALTAAFLFYSGMQSFAHLCWSPIPPHSCRQNSAFLWSGGSDSTAVARFRLDWLPSCAVRAANSYYRVQCMKKPRFPLDANRGG